MDRSSNNSRETQSTSRVRGNTSDFSRQEMRRSSTSPLPEARNVTKPIYENKNGPQQHRETSQTIEEPSIEEQRSQEFVHKQKIVHEQIYDYEIAKKAILSLKHDVDKLKTNMDKLLIFVARNRGKVAQFSQEINESTAKIEELKGLTDLKTEEIACIQEELDTNKARFRHLREGIKESTSQLESLKLAHTENQDSAKSETNKLERFQERLDELDIQLKQKEQHIISLDEEIKKSKNKITHYESIEIRSREAAEKIVKYTENARSLKDLQERMNNLNTEHGKIDNSIKITKDYISWLEGNRKCLNEKPDQTPFQNIVSSTIKQMETTLTKNEEKVKSLKIGLDSKLATIQEIINKLAENGKDVKDLKSGLDKLATDLTNLRANELVSISKDFKAAKQTLNYLIQRQNSFMDEGLIAGNDHINHKLEVPKERTIFTEKELVASQKRLKVYDRLATSYKDAQKREALKFVASRLMHCQRIDARTKERMSNNAREFSSIATIQINAQEAASYESLLQYAYYYTNIECKVHELWRKIEIELIDHLKTVEETKIQQISERKEIKALVQDVADEAKKIFPSSGKENLDAKIQRCESSIRTEQSKKENLDMQLAKKQASILELKSKVNELTEHSKNEIASFKELENQQTKLKQKITSIENEKQQFGREIADLGKAIQKLKNEQKTLALDIDKGDKILDKAIYEQNIIQQFTNYKAQIDCMSSEKDDLNIKIKEHKESIDQRRKEKNKLHLEIKEYENIAQRLENQLRNKNKQIKKDQPSIEKANALISQAEQKIAVNKQKKKEIEEILDKMYHEMEESNAITKEYPEKISYEWSDQTIEVPARKVGYFDEDGTLQAGKMTKEGHLIGENQKPIYPYSYFGYNLYCVETSSSAEWGGP